MNRIRGWIVGATAALAAVAVPAVAQDAAEGPGKLSSTVSFMNDYVFRGISQSDEHPAVQGSIDYTYQFEDNLSGYFGIFGSNVDFDDGDEASIEVDLYAGLKPKFGSAELDIGVIAYLYPGAGGGTEYNYFEGKLGASYDFGFAIVSASAFYSPDYSASSNDSLYLMGGVDVPLPFGLALEGHIGHQWITQEQKFGTPDYLDWHVGIRFNYEGFVFAARYFDTDMSKDECFGGLDWCGARFVASVSRTF